MRPPFTLVSLCFVSATLDRVISPTVNLGTESNEATHELCNEAAHNLGRA
jgi:hypothetical protein